MFEKRLRGGLALLFGGRTANLNRITAPVAELNLLEFTKLVLVPEVPTFSAASHFKVNTSENADVKIAYLWSGFKKSLRFKRESNIPAGSLRIQTLRKSSRDGPIITALGSGHRTYVSDVWALLLRQGKGEEGALRVDGYANIFYIGDGAGNLFAVSVFWHADVGGGWGVNVEDVSDPGFWSKGDVAVARLFSEP